MTADQILGSSPAINRLRDVIGRVAPTNTRVLITGENGSGKELVAQAVHRLSRRADKPLVVLNCAAVPAELIESELFGHVRGAFTGAVGDRAGRFEMADGGTLFLDEVGDMPQAMQAKLLRALQQGEVTRVGASQPIHVDVRVIAATNRDLSKDVAAGKFRQDLYYRLAVLHLQVPALRDRRSDIPLLLDAALQRAAESAGRPAPMLTPSARALIAGQQFPGNVRELENLAERIVVLCPVGTDITAYDLVSLVGDTKVDLELLRDLERGSAQPVAMPQGGLPVAAPPTSTTVQPLPAPAPARPAQRRQRSGPAPVAPPRTPDPSGGPDHGTATRYGRGCRCADCRAANTYRSYVWRQERAAGTPEPPAPELQ